MFAKGHHFQESWLSSLRWVFSRARRPSPHNQKSLQCQQIGRHKTRPKAPNLERLVPLQMHLVLLASRPPLHIYLNVSLVFSAKGLWGKWCSAICEKDNLFVSSCNFGVRLLPRCSRRGWPILAAGKARQQPQATIRYYQILAWLLYIVVYFCILLSYSIIPCMSLCPF